MESGKTEKINKTQHKIIIYLLLLCIVTAGLHIHSYALPAVKNLSKESNLEVHFLDVGNADCILLKADGQTMLIDAGNNHDQSYILNYLDEQEITALDYVIITHPHEDHIGGMDAVLKKYPVSRLFLSQGIHHIGSYKTILNVIEDNQFTISKAAYGRSFSFGRGRFTIVTPSIFKGAQELNDYSIGIRLEYGSRSFLLCGDAGKALEKEIVSSPLLISSDVLKINHHGSHDASSEVFLDAAIPSYAVITCEKGNPHGHPHKKVLNRLKKRNITVYRTDLHGTIVFYSDGETLSSNLEDIEVQ